MKLTNSIRNFVIKFQKIIIVLLICLALVLNIVALYVDEVRLSGQNNNVREGYWVKKCMFDIEGTSCEEQNTLCTVYKVNTVFAVLYLLIILLAYSMKYNKLTILLLALCSMTTVSLYIPGIIESYKKCEPNNIGLSTNLYFATTQIQTATLIICIMLCL